jgi:hypothetical protein
LRPPGPGTIFREQRPTSDSQGDFAVEELQVPTHRVAVELYTDRGEHFPGALFVTEARYHTDRVEDLRQALNDERAFMPFQAEDPEAGCGIVNKLHVTRIKLKGRPDELLAEGAEARPEGKACRLILADGTRLAGEVTVETPWSLSRLVDKLNQAEPFLLVVTSESVEFVQTRHIVGVN